MPESDLSKRVFAETADRAYPVVRDVFERGAGGDTAVRIADFGIIDIAAGTFVLHGVHPFLLFSVFSRRTAFLIP